MMRFAYDEQKHYRRLVHILNGELTREDLEGMDPEDVTEITKMIGKTRSKAKEILSDPGLEKNGRIRGCDDWQNPEKLWMEQTRRNCDMESISRA